MQKSYFMKIMVRKKSTGEKNKIKCLLGNILVKLIVSMYILFYSTSQAEIL